MPELARSNSTPPSAVADGVSRIMVHTGASERLSEQIRLELNTQHNFHQALPEKSEDIAKLIRSLDAEFYPGAAGRSSTLSGAPASTHARDLKDFEVMAEEIERYGQELLGVLRTERRRAAYAEQFPAIMAALELALLREQGFSTSAEVSESLNALDAQREQIERSYFGWGVTFRSAQLQDIRDRIRTLETLPGQLFYIPPVERFSMSREKNWSYSDTLSQAGEYHSLVTEFEQTIQSDLLELLYTGGESGAKPAISGDVAINIARAAVEQVIVPVLSDASSHRAREILGEFQAQGKDDGDSKLRTISFYQALAENAARSADFTLPPHENYSITALAGPLFRAVEKILDYSRLLNLKAEIMALPAAQADFLSAARFPAELLYDFDPHLWSAAARCGAVPAGTLSELAQQVRQQLGRQAQEELMASSGQRSETMRLGRSLYHFADADCALAAILNAFKERGHSGEFPFLHQRLSGENVLGLYLDSLSDETLKELQARNIPGLMDFIQECRGRPECYLDRRTAIEYDDGVHYVESQKWCQVRGYLTQMCMHLLNSERASETLFATGVLKNLLTQPTEEVAQGFCRVLQSTEKMSQEQASSITLEIVNFILEMESPGSALTEAILKQFADSQSATATLLGEAACSTQAARIFGSRLMHAGSAEEITAFSKIFGVSQEAFQRIWSGARELQSRLESGQWISRFSPEPDKIMARLIEAFSPSQSLENLSRAFKLTETEPDFDREVVPFVLNNIEEIERLFETFPSLRQCQYQPDEINGRVFVNPIVTQLFRLGHEQAAEFIDSLLSETPSSLDKVCEAFCFSVSRIPAGDGTAGFKAQDMGSRFEGFLDFFDAIARSEMSSADKYRSYLTGKVFFDSGLQGKGLADSMAGITMLVERFGEAAPRIAKMILVIWPECTESAESFQALTSQIRPLLGGMIPDEDRFEAFAGLCLTARRISPGSTVTNQLDMVRSFVKEFGVVHLERTFIAWAELDKGSAVQDSLSDDLKECGVTRQGPAGKAQFRAHIAAIREQLLQRDGSIRSTGQIDLEILAFLVRFEESSWSRSNSLASLLGQYNRDHDAGLISATPAFLQKGSRNISKIEERALNEFRFTESAVKRFYELRNDFGAAFEEDSGLLFRSGVSAVSEVFKQRILELSRPLSAEELQLEGSQRRAAGRASSADRLQKLLDKLEDADKSSAGLPAILAILVESEQSTVPVVAEFMRRSTLMWCLSNLNHSINIRRLATQEISVNSFSEVMSAVNDLVLAEGIPRLGLTGVTRKKVEQVFSTAALSDELVRINRLATSGYEAWTFHPTRGVLAEFSGYIGDACWTAEQDLMRRYPNVTAVIFERAAGTPEARLAGAVMLIDAVDADGNKTLVIRGFNPLQNYITRLQAQSFVEEFLDWLAPQAEKAGYRQIVIPDGVAGGSQTNRPTVSAYISEEYSAAQVIFLKDTPDTTFNNYILGECIVLRSLGNTL